MVTPGHCLVLQTCVTGALAVQDQSHLCIFNSVVTGVADGSLALGEWGWSHSNGCHCSVAAKLAVFSFNRGICALHFKNPESMLSYIDELYKIYGLHKTAKSFSCSHSVATCMSSPRSMFPERSRWTRLLGMDGLALSDWQRLFTPIKHTHTHARTEANTVSVITALKSPLDVLTVYWRKWQEMSSGRRQERTGSEYRARAWKVKRVGLLTVLEV